jgi:hypothetical protein
MEYLQKHPIQYLDSGTTSFPIDLHPISLLVFAEIALPYIFLIQSAHIRQSHFIIAISKVISTFSIDLSNRALLLFFIDPS